MVDYRASAIITVVATGALIPVAMLPILARTARRYGRLRGWPLATGAGLVASAVALAAYTVLPLPDASELRCYGGLTSSWILDPRTSIVPILGAVRADGAGVVLDPVFQQFFYNVLLFAPFGFFLHQVTRWSAWSVAGGGLVLSAAIEATQGTAFLGLYPCPYRTFDVADIVANSGGALGGALLSSAVIVLIPAATPRPVPDTSPPSVGRRAVATLVDAGLAGVLAAGAVGAAAVYLGLRDGATRAEAFLENRSIWAIALLVGTALVAVAHPMLRRDRSTAGQAVVNVGPARASSPAHHADAWQVVVRWAVRWAVLALAPSAGIVAALVVAEVLCIVLTPGRTSLAGLAGRTVTRTLPWFAFVRHGFVEVDADPPRG